MIGRLSRFVTTLCAVVAIALCALVLGGASPAAATGTGSIQGTISPDFGGALDPAANILVVAYSSSPTWGGTTWVDNATGHYSIDGIPPGSYVVSFDDQGPAYVDEYYNDQSTADAADIVVVSAGATQQVDAGLAATGSISGTVTPVGGGALSAEADITVTAYDGPDSPRTSSPVNGVTGAYQLGALPRGSYRLKFQDSSGVYVTEYYLNQPTWDGAQGIVVGPGTPITGVDIALRRSPPSEPLAATAVAGDAAATVSWTVPENEQVSHVLHYTVTSNPDSRTCTTGGATTCTVLGLRNDVSYTFTVTAANAAGTSAASSPSNWATPRAVVIPTPPSAPAKSNQSIAGGPPTRLKRGKRVRLPVATTARIRIVWRSRTTKICKVKSGQVLAGAKVGTCRLSAQAAGTSAVNPWSANFTIKLR